MTAGEKAEVGGTIEATFDYDFLFQVALSTIGKELQFDLTKAMSDHPDERKVVVQLGAGTLRSGTLAVEGRYE